MCFVHRTVKPQTAVSIRMPGPVVADLSISPSPGNEAEQAKPPAVVSGCPHRPVRSSYQIIKWQSFNPEECS